MDEIDSIVLHHVESIDTVFDDLKKALATPPTTTSADTAESESPATDPNFLKERIDAAQQR